VAGGVHNGGASTQDWCKGFVHYRCALYFSTPYYFFYPHGAAASSGRGVFIIEASRSHSGTPHSVGLHWTSDQPDPKTVTWQHTTFTRDKTSMLLAGFELAIPKVDWPQTHALDRVAILHNTQNYTPTSVLWRIFVLNFKKICEKVYTVDENLSLWQYLN
jgi:hypothetical protein